MKQARGFAFDLFFTVFLFGLFSVLALGVVCVGASVYESAAKSMQQNYTSRTALLYVTEKMRQSDCENSIYISQVEGTPALCLLRQEGTEKYATYIYYYEGAVRELLVKADAAPALIGGQAVVQAGGFAIEPLTNSLFRLRVTDSEGAESTALFLARSSQNGEVSG